MDLKMSIRERYVGMVFEGGAMRFLTFSDIHGDFTAVKKLLATDVDLYVSVGDISRGDRDSFIEFMRLCGQKRVFAVPGNNDRPEWIPNYMNLHGEKKTFMGVTFGGLGGSPRTPFNTIFEWEEDYAYEVLEKIGYVDVLVSHAPPSGTVLSLTYSGKEAGSEAVRWYIEEYVPSVAVVGHIHERGGKTEKLGGTTVINPGKSGAIIEISPGEEPRILWL